MLTHGTPLDLKKILLEITVADGYQYKMWVVISHLAMAENYQLVIVRLESPCLHSDYSTTTFPYCICISQVRILRQKMSRAESRDRRRTQSLKGRESFTLSKDMEAKLGQLEAKVEQLLKPKDDSSLPGVRTVLECDFFLFFFNGIRRKLKNT